MASTSWAGNMHASMLTRLSDKLSRFACGFSPSAIMAPPHHDVELAEACRFSDYAGFSSALLMLSPNRDNENESLSSSSYASSSSRITAAAEALQDPPAEDKETTLPCVAFPSQHGYMVFSLAEDRLRDGVRLRPVTGRRIVPSPYGGALLATDLTSFRHPSRLVDPFTGESRPLPDLPVPLWYKEPSSVCEPEAPRVQGRRRAVPPTDDGFAWDRSPRGVMIARGDTRTLVTTVIDARTLDKVADIWPPRGDYDDAVDCVHLVASTDDVFLLVHRARDMYCELFSEVYRARHKKPTPEWSKVTDIGDRALFVDRLHGFSVGVGGEDTAAGIKRNCVYTISATPVEDPQGRRVVVYNVEEFHLDRPEVGGTLECRLGGSQVEQMWGEPYWMIPMSREDPQEVNSIVTGT
ncbi:unnamed protein product [Miscanthus lutarioriparius]|uniref:KIB1-4 beta-propeller domain-containing protein n=1 Tax=Miscanthus lutarioriparius TaxID=422564 RepID=A0A811PB30_9POAL|nr:unnamed protein product [Miscanthus lutarioriparius]